MYKWLETTQSDLMPYSGTLVRVGKELTDQERDPEVGRMWHITLYNGKRIDAFEDELFDLTETEKIKFLFQNQPRYVPRKRIALDCRIWWCVYDLAKQKYSTGLRHGKYKTKREAKYAIARDMQWCRERGLGNNASVLYHDELRTRECISVSNERSGKNDV